jgi:hypothetical protein
MIQSLMIPFRRLTIFHISHSIKHLAHSVTSDATRLP